MRGRSPGTLHNDQPILGSTLHGRGNCIAFHAQPNFALQTRATSSKSWRWNLRGLAGLAWQGIAMFLLLRRAAGILALLIAFALSPHAATAAHSAIAAQLHSTAQHHPCDSLHCNRGDFAPCCGSSHCVTGLPQQPYDTSSVVQREQPTLLIATVPQLAIDRRLDRPPKRRDPPHLNSIQQRKRS